VFALVVTDNLGAVSQPASVSVTVNPSLNAVPIANAGTSQTITLPTNSVVLDGSASSDADGTIAFYRWSQTSGPNTATFSPNATAQKPTVSGLIAGTYVFALVVTDNLGAVSQPASVTITVLKRNGKNRIMSEDSIPITFNEVNRIFTPRRSISTNTISNFKTQLIASGTISSPAIFGINSLSIRAKNLHNTESEALRGIMKDHDVKTRSNKFQI
jgi:hypothetical protein